MAAIALLALVLAIVIGTVKHINIGIMGIIAACILSIVAGLPAKAVAGGFGSLLFLRLVSIQMLICIAQANGTMDVLATKIINISCRKNIRLFPIIVYIAMVVCTVMGFDVTFLIPPFLIAIAFQLHIDPLKVFFPYALAFIAAGCSPLAVTGANAVSIAEKSEIIINGWNVPFVGILTCTIMFVIFYFVFGWNKQENVQLDSIKNATFDSKQILTLLGFVAYVILTVFFKWDILVAPAVISFVLFCLDAAKPQKVITALPWNVLILIGGMSVLSSVVFQLGGVELLSNMIASVANPIISAPLVMATASAMSFFSSGNGVVIPTLIPTIPAIVSAGAVGQVTALVTAVVIGASSTGISPMSTIGGNWMSCYDSLFKPTEGERHKVFTRQLLFVLGCMGLQIIFALLGLYRINPF